MLKRLLPLFFGALAIVATLAVLQASAAELIMFEQAGCVWCARFDHEIAPIYPKTDEGQIAPLRRVDIYGPVPNDLTFVVVERITPVFVLVDQGHEIGRIRGYPGEANFWGLLTNLVKKLEPPKTAPLRTEINSTAIAALALAAQE